MTSDTRARTRSTVRRSARSRATEHNRVIPNRKRLDLQGLRALAVGLVMLNHAFGWPSGGFVGVDIFFVISGFLMTSVLYAEYERSGSISLLAFYRRRIRRLIPASAAVIVATIAVSFLLFTPSRAMNTLWDGVAALFFVVNWRFADQQTDYFMQGAATSPLQHYWSLSLEEQYYLVWPVTIVLIGLLVSRTRNRRLNAALIVVVITAALYGVSQYLTITTIATAYFITPARLWELSVGAIVALGMPLFERMGRGPRPAIMITALAGMVFAAAITPSEVGFPAPWAALAVLSTALFIAFPWRPRVTWLNPLDNPLLGYLGDISYSLYLWHFPAIILIVEAYRGVPGADSPMPETIALLATIVIAALSYRFIEEPVRRSRWLESKKKGAGGVPFSKFALGGLAAAMVIAVVLALTVDTNVRSTGGQADAGPRPTSTPNPSAGSGDGEEVLKNFSTSIRTAIAAKEWPAELVPSVDSVMGGYEHDKDAHACGIDPYPGVEACTWGSPEAPISVTLVGDSTSIAYTAMMRSLAESSDGQLKVTTFALYSCLFADVMRESPDPAAKRSCAERKELAIAEIAKLKPTYVFITNVLTDLKVEDGSELTAKLYQEGLERYLARIAPNTGKVVFLTNTPTEINFMKCYSPRVSPKECLSHTQPVWKSLGLAERKAAATVDGVWVDTRPVYCSGDTCPSFVDGIIVRFDYTHITDEYSIHIAPGMVALLDAAGVQLRQSSEAPAEPPADAPAETG